MRKVILAVAAAGLWMLAGPVLADQQSATFGGDSYAAGLNTTIAASVERDAFGAGNSVVLAAPVARDAHLAGLDVQSNSDIGGNLYAFGFSVSIGGSVKGDITGFGNTVTVHTSQPLVGNLRAAAGNLTLSSPVDGSALITAETATLNAPVKGDLSFFGNTLTFGPNASVAGQLLIHAPAPITVPDGVAPAGRVVYTPLTSPNYPTQAGQTAEMVAKGFLVALWALTLWWVLLIAVGAGFIALKPGLVGKLELLGAVRPLRRFGLGLLAVACAIGLVPAVVLTGVGLLLLPAIPIVLIGVAILFSLAYIAGAYLIALAIGRRMTQIATVGRKIVVLAIALVIGGALGMIPILGWLLGFCVATYGFGVLAALVMTSWSTDDRARLQAATPAPPTPSTNPQPA